MTAPKCTSWISCLPAPVDALCCGPTTTKIEPGAPVLLVVRLHALQERLPGCAGGVAAGAAAGREAQDAHARLPRPQHQADEARPEGRGGGWPRWVLRKPVSYTHLRAHETRHDLVCRLLLEKKKKKKAKKLP